MDPQLLNLSKKQLALLVHKLKKLHQEPIAVIGMACRFPGQNNTPAQFWNNLVAGKSAIDDIPEERWIIEKYYSHDAKKTGTMYSKKGGFLKEPTPDLFDASFFRLSHNEASNIDPQQRLLLEVAWESLENANIVPDSLAGSKTGVFLGIGSNDYIFNIDSYDQVNEYTALGNEYSVSSGRLSYFFGLEGPSMAIDTACSSSLVSVHIACNSLSNGECDLALVGGSQLILSPQFNISLSKAGVLSPTDKCSVFDAKADGYVRGEGCGLVVLKKLRHALKDNDNV